QGASEGNYRGCSSVIGPLTLPILFHPAGHGGGGRGLGATRWAGVEPGVELGNLKLVRFLRTRSRLLTFIGCSCTIAVRAAASRSISSDPIRRSCCQIADRPS